jgi:hypothetical protein
MGDGLMPTWGQTSTTNATNSGSFGSTFRMMGGTSPNTSGMTLQSVSLDFSGTGQSIRVAVYTGGTSLSDPVGATLVEDLGQITINGTRQFWTVNSSTTPSIPQNASLWIAVKQGTGATGYWSTSSADAGDFQTARGRFQMSGQTNGTDPTLAFPSTLNGTSSFALFWYAWYLTYSTASASASTPAFGRYGVRGPIR